MKTESSFQELVESGRESAGRYAWQDAFESFDGAGRAGKLASEDLLSLAEAAWWIGQPDRTIQAREQAFAALMDAGLKVEAAGVATNLHWDHYGKNSHTLALGWLNRAAELLEDEPESAQHGWLAQARSGVMIDLGQFDDAIQLGQEAAAAGHKFGVRELQVLGKQLEGTALIQKGEATAGLKLVDEAAMAAVSGELNRFYTGVVFCFAIHTCASLADYRRAAEWTASAARWCERQGVQGFPGLCRVHRAEIIRLRGDWAAAEQEAKQACIELKDYFQFAVGWGHYEIGMVRLKQGDLKAADEAFNQAYELGKNPQPGRALALLAQGKVDSAMASIRRALADESVARLSRGHLLPAQVEIAVAASDLETARTASIEMDAIAEEFGSTALLASAAWASALVLLHEGDLEGAERSAVKAQRVWQEVDIPYEIARTHVLLGKIFAAQGDSEAASMEFKTARSTFVRLGALPDARELDALSPQGAAAGVRTTRTFMFTDIVKSTNLVEAIGDAAWEDLLEWHDRALRSLFAEHKGEEVKQVGDGFVVAFESPASGVACAVAIQRTLKDHRRAQGFAPSVRIGLHETETTKKGEDYQGRGIHLAARVGALAKGDEIVASVSTVEAAGSLWPVSEPRSVEVKGIADSIEVVTLDWR